MQAKATVRDLRKHRWRGEVVQRQSHVAVIEPHVFVRLSLMRVVSLFRDRCGFFELDSRWDQKFGIKF